MGSFPCLILLSLGYTLAKCPSKQTQQCGPIQQCRQTCNNFKLQSIKPQCDTLDCVDGCFCPASAPVETWNSNFRISCVKSMKNCHCEKDQIFKTCSDIVIPTCNHPVVKKQPDECGSPRCQCDEKKPIWHEGKCISKKKCTCPDTCLKAGCSVCNKCECDFGNPARCEKKNCPDIRTPEGLKALQRNGCWRLSPSGDQCVFYSPCQDEYGEIDCNSEVTIGQGNKFCSRCHKCQCNEDNKQSCANDNNCQYLLTDRGCWTLLKDNCVFISPCPEEENKACQSLQPGLTMCKMCHKCECVNGVKICSGEKICPDPKDRGCYIMRKYVSEKKKCYFVSPCPPNVSPTQTLQCRPFDITGDFCYLHNARDDTCEFVSPCPLITACSHGDTICNKCNECKCRNGIVQCTNEKCGDPIPNGCWVQRGNECVFLSPCPNDVVIESEDFCNTNPTGNFCRSCNICSCTAEGFALCTQKGCPLITESMGCYLSMHGTCVFMAPCPTVQ